MRLEGTDTVRFNGDEWAYSQEQGWQRTYEGRNTPDKASNQQGKNMHPSAEADGMAIQCEKAVGFYLEADLTNPSVWMGVAQRDQYGNLPDECREKPDIVIGGIGWEVRRSDSPGGWLKIEHKDIKADAIVVSTYLSHEDIVNEDGSRSLVRVDGTVILKGWYRARDIDDRPWRSYHIWSKAKNCYYIPQERLRPIDTMPMPVFQEWAVLSDAKA